MCESESIERLFEAHIRFFLDNFIEFLTGTVLTTCNFCGRLTGGFEPPDILFPNSQ